MLRQVCKNQPETISIRLFITTLAGRDIENQEHASILYMKLLFVIADIGDNVSYYITHENCSAALKALPPSVNGANPGWLK